MRLLGQSVLLGVPPDVILTTLNRRQFFSLNLRCLLNSLRHMTLALDSSDLGHVRVSVNQSLVVLQLGPLASTLDSTAVGGIGTPESDVAIVRSREDVLVVGGEFGGEDTMKRLDLWFCKKVERKEQGENIPLHSLRVIDVARMAICSVPQTHCPVIRCRYQVFTRRTELDVHDSRNMVLEYIQGAIHLPHVKYVNIVIFVGNRKVECLHGIPRNGIGRQMEDKLAKW